MSGAKPSRGRKVYDQDSPYPVTLRDTRAVYEDRRGHRDDGEPAESSGPEDLFESLDLIRDERPRHWSSHDALVRDECQRPGPLSVLSNLFSDRLDFLHAALRELEQEKSRREGLAAQAFEDIDSHIRDCDRAIALLRDNKLLNDFDRRRHLERQLLELKRQRRQEAIMSWRDLVSLKREIRALKREIDSLGKAISSTPNRDALT